DSPSGWQRDMAQQMLIARKDPAAGPLLKELAAESQRPLCRLHALCTLDGLAALDARTLEAALADPHPGVRRHAVRLAEPLLNGSPAVAAAVVKLGSDDDPQVRMQVALSLGAWDDAAAGAALAQLARRDADDRFVAAAVLSSLTNKNLEPT